MKPLLTLVILVFGLGFLQADDHPLRRLDGLWYNQYKNRTIEIHAYQDGLKVRGLRAGNRWVWFERTNPNTYHDQYGNRLKVYNHYIRYNARHFRGKLTFIKMGGNDRNDDHYRNSDRSRNDSRSRDRQNQGRWDDDDFEDVDDYNYYDETSKNWNKRNDDARTTNGDRISKNEDRANDIEGTWSVDHLGKKVFITETRDGFKARFNDETKWYSFTKQDSGTYMDENRNKYYFENGQLIWEDGKGSRKYNLTKMSDEYGNE